MKKLYIQLITVLSISIFSSILRAQSSLPFEIEIESLNVPQLGGIQSYAFGQSDGKWLIVGGRLDGLHKRQPFASFDVAGNNNSLVVIDPDNKQKWSAPLNTLPVAVQEQLSSTNMEFYQEGDVLYCIGGYGFSATLNNHTTYANITAINVPLTIQAIINGKDFKTFISQSNDTRIQVTGGKLKKIDSKYYLLGGHKFIGRYNPMGPNNGPGFTQEYTNSVKIFDLKQDINGIPQISNYKEWVNLDLFHKRDYNAEPQILPNGKQGIMLFSGVFRTDSNLPILNTSSIDGDSFIENAGFSHLLHNYHCPVIPMYSQKNSLMYNVFFGGIAQYFYNNGLLMKDDNVPFVKTISCVVRDDLNRFKEVKLDLELPEFLGAGAEYIPLKTVPSFENHVHKYDEIDSARILIGHIYGGISSTAANIFFSNGTDLSKASSMIYRVFLKKSKQTLSINNMLQATNFSIFPNPYNDFLTILCPDNRTQTIEIYNSLGQRIHRETIIPYQNKCKIQLSNLTPNTPYYMKVLGYQEVIKFSKKDK